MVGAVDVVGAVGVVVAAAAGGVVVAAGATAAAVAAAGWRGSSETIEFSSMVTEPVTRPPVSGP